MNERLYAALFYHRSTEVSDDRLRLENTEQEEEKREHITYYQGIWIQIYKVIRQGISILDQEGNNSILLHYIY
ncbi:hypothetical protein PanWU01x14_351860 [Parasponia andersonii]|uniref:Uncharacterized protein n=1 Tax=Parasponia andersonii TaxID=3476 RepID=A0A2P5AAH7_PARAD|nr:hypothetical protein PanWU01x14_351860 [Parasponia andersonii]